MNFLIQTLLSLIDLYHKLLWAYVIIHILLYFNVLNTYNHFVRQITHFLTQMTEPVLRKIRPYVPIIANIDLSVLALFFILNFVRNLLISLII